jgi:hypothetical protein
MDNMTSVCSNQWCKATFNYTKNELIEDENGNFLKPNVCNKCKSFDTELSGGVSWKTKEYEGPRFDNEPHPMIYKIKKYF